MFRVKSKVLTQKMRRRILTEIIEFPFPKRIFRSECRKWSKAQEGINFNKLPG